MKLEKHLPWLAFAFAVFGALLMMRPGASVRGLDLEAFAALPVLEGGRVKPVDSVGRNALLMIRSQQSFRFEGRSISAREWLTDVLFRPEVANKQPIFVINDPEVLGLMGRAPGTSRYYAFSEVEPYLMEIQNQAGRAKQIPAQQRNRFEAAVVNLFDRLYLYHRLQCTLQAPDGEGLAADLTGARPDTPQRAMAMAERAHFRMLPPLAGQPKEAWQSVGEALMDGANRPGMAALARLGQAVRAGDGAAFNAAVGEVKALVNPQAASTAASELRFNRAQPFLVGMALYVAALLALFASWAVKPELLRRTAFALLLAGLLVHTAGLAARVVLQGRPPVTNLYSSAIFVGWGAAVLGAFLERFHRRGFGILAAGAAGFGSLLVAQHLADMGDTMEMMRAVLDSNFWLATHVVTITIGYSGTFLAGGLAIFHTLRRHLVRTPDPEADKALSSLVYGVLAFSLLFSFVGTVLGGIWADQSWGRFWGWDPKENGALFIVLWIAIILHARWAGLARERGVMAMTIGGNIITSLSWFGVNMLGVGLHSYGFMDSAFWSLMGFIASQLLLIGLALMPRRGASTVQ